MPGKTLFFDYILGYVLRPSFPRTTADFYRLSEVRNGTYTGCNYAKDVDSDGCIVDPSDSDGCMVNPSDSDRCRVNPSDIGWMIRLYSFKYGLVANNEPFSFATAWRAKALGKKKFERPLS